MIRLARVLANPVALWVAFAAATLAGGWFLGGALGDALARWFGHLGLAPWGVMLALAPVAIALGWVLGRSAHALRSWSRRRLAIERNRRYDDALADLRARLGQDHELSVPDDSPLARYLQGRGEHGKGPER